MIRISIVTPSYNQAQYLEQTIQSVLSQKYENLQYIIVDGGSTDGSVEIIKRYDKYLDFWISEPDSGQGEAINKGLSKCNGEVFNWINSDDILAKSSLDYVANKFANANIDILGGSYELFWGNDISNGKTIAYSELKDIHNTIGNTLMHQPSTFMRLNRLLEICKLKETLKYIMDQDLWIRYLLKYGQNKIQITDKILAHFRVHNTSKTFYFGNDKFWDERDSYFYTIAKRSGLEEQAKAMKIQNSKIVELSLKVFETPKNLKLIRQSINSQYKKRARQFIYESDYKEAILSTKVISNCLLFMLIYLRLKTDSLIRTVRRYFPKR